MLFSKKGRKGTSIAPVSLERVTSLFLLFLAVLIVVFFNVKNQAQKRFIQTSKRLVEFEKKRKELQSEMQKLNATLALLEGITIEPLPPEEILEKLPVLKDFSISSSPPGSFVNTGSALYIVWRGEEEYFTLEEILEVKNFLQSIFGEKRVVLVFAGPPAFFAIPIMQNFF